MTWLRHHWRGICRVVGVLLLVGGLWGAYWWFYKLGPLRHRLSPEWVAAHSRLEFWHEIQKGVRRGTWFHDDAIAIGRYGDKSWTEFLLTHIRRDSRLDGCFGDGPAHADGALQSLSNQDLGHEANAWLDWWEKNKSKSQEQWIAEGFHQRGFDIDVPPSPMHIPRLLVVLGNAETNASTSVPSYMKYNAFRCLRESGFEPVAFVITNRILSAELQRGLVEYARRERFAPAANGVGILPFGKKTGSLADLPLPLILTPQFQVAAYCFIFGPLVLGAVLVLRSFRKRINEDKPGCPHQT